MPSYEWIQYKGKRILYVDFASQKPEEILDLIKRFKEVVAKEPPHSVLGVCNVRGGMISTEINNAFKDGIKDTDPYVKMIAITGIEGLQSIMFNGIVMFTRTKKLVLKKSKEEALDFLAGL
ncbi:MAG TPA: hypothetical protein VMU29_02310 [Smithella sp.]|nr:hypothetical protein [Smithella sp.]